MRIPKREGAQVSSGRYCFVEQVSQQILTTAEQAVSAGAEVQILRFAA
jgi:hypothetical protein